MGVCSTMYPGQRYTYTPFRVGLGFGSCKKETKAVHDHDAMLRICMTAKLVYQHIGVLCKKEHGWMSCPVCSEPGGVWDTAALVLLPTYTYQVHPNHDKRAPPHDSSTSSQGISTFCDACIISPIIRAPSIVALALAAQLVIVPELGSSRSSCWPTSALAMPHSPPLEGRGGGGIKKDKRL